MPPVLLESDCVGALADHYMALIWRVDELDEHFLRHVKGGILIPLREDQKRRNTDVFWLPGRFPGSPIIDDILEDTVGRAQHRRTLLRPGRISRKIALPPCVKPRARADFLDPLRR